MAAGETGSIALSLLNPFVGGLAAGIGGGPAPTGNQSINVVGSPLSNIGAILQNLNSGSGVNGGFPVNVGSPLGSGGIFGNFAQGGPIFSGPGDEPRAGLFDGMTLLIIGAAVVGFFLLRR